MTRLGRYQLLEKLGEGGMGAVWLGRLTGEGGFEKLCIIKTVLPAIAKDQQFVSRFLHEGRVLTQLQHSNIAQVFDMGREGDTVFLALEYVPGLDLSRLTEHLRSTGQAFPVPVAVYVIQQVAEGLGFAHRKASADGKPFGIVHRDVSPQNVMVSFDGEVKVIDFGIAKSEARSHATAQASVLGKLGYMAPEQARGEPVDARADQYACGVLLWELLSGAAFVPRGTMTEMVVAMANPTIKPLSPLRPEVPASLEAVVLKALAPKPEARFDTTDDFAHALMAQLLTLTGMPTKRQLGEWVRANCPADFQANQALLTRISSTKPTLTDDGQTLVRTPTEPGGSARRVDVGSTRDIERAAMPASRVPVLAALVVGMLAVLGVAVYFVQSRPKLGDASAVVRIAPKQVAEVFEENGQTFVRAGSRNGLHVGDAVPLVEERADAEGRRAVVGQATVLEVGDGRARVHADAVNVSPVFAAVQAAAPVVPAPLPPTAPKPAPLEYEPVADAGASAVAIAVDAGLPELKMKGRLSAGAGWSLILTNDSPAQRDCVITLSGQRVARVKAIPRFGSEVFGTQFRVEATAAEVRQKTAVIACSTGSAVVSL